MVSQTKMKKVMVFRIIAIDDLYHLLPETIFH
jgi:hypothetical protein